MYEVKLELKPDKYYGPEYTKSGLPLYGSIYRDVYQYEIMYYRVRQSYIDKHKLNNVNNKWFAGLRRKANIHSQLVSNYCGD